MHPKIRDSYHQAGRLQLKDFPNAIFLSGLVLSTNATPFYKWICQDYKVATVTNILINSDNAQIVGRPDKFVMPDDAIHGLASCDNRHHGDDIRDKSYQQQMYHQVLI